ncbi:MAG TPA: PQQ-binding-like beta-propeller repeat protein [Verrucomicrobiales bacterium]|jgi:outer membrane protein assembly factor BamB|nr:PQQ-binding-like beta-propeller repeat protein [Verrucomicrobiales bacterium]
MKTLSRIMFIISGPVLAGGAGSVQAQDWPQWRGPNRDGKAAVFTAPKTWPKALTQKWKVTVGDGVATPSLVGDKLYVFARQEGGEIIRCLNAATGDEIWKEKYDAQGADGPAGSFSGPRCSPAVAEGKVVVLGVRGALVCLDAATGKVAWRKDDFPGALPRFYTSASPVILNGMCIAQVGGRDKGGIVAYDLAKGDEKWKWTGDAPAYASPVLMTIGDAKLVVAQTETKMVALNAADGKLVWEAPFKVEGRGYNAATPIVSGQTIIYTGSNRGTTAVKLEKEGDGYAAKELWKNPDVSVQFNSPILKDGFVYGLSARNELFCLNAADGKTAWTAPSAPPAPNAAPEARPADAPPPPPDGPGAGRRPGGPGGGRGMRGGGGGGYGSIVDAGSVLIALTPSSQLIVFQPGGKAYTEVARIKVADSPTHAYPVVSGNRIITKDKDSVTLWTVDG